METFRATQLASAVCIFEWQFPNCKAVYSCRTSGQWDGDIALTVTFFPQTLTTNAVWYGCNFTKRFIHGYNIDDYELITKRLINFDCPAFHPMLLPTIFADFERERQIPLVRKHLRKLVEKLLDLSNSKSQPDIIRSTAACSGNTKRPSSKAHWIQSLLGSVLTNPKVIQLKLDPDSNFHFAEKKSPSLTPTPLVNEDSSVRLWLEIGDLRNGLETWRAQLVKMLSHVEELDRSHFCVNSGINEETKFKGDALREAGERIKERLQDLIDENDEFIRECVKSMDGMTLATQLVGAITLLFTCVYKTDPRQKKELNKIGRQDALTNQEISTTNLQVAIRTRHDGYVMKSIAVLGMVFLPGTFVSVSAPTMDYAGAGTTN